MTKAELKKISALRAKVAKLKDELADLPPRGRFSETVMMSSHDEASRVVTSRVVSLSGMGERERKLRLELAASSAELARLASDAALFVDAVPDGRMRRILFALYLDEPPLMLKEAADRIGISYTRARHLHAAFWNCAARAREIQS
jgi:hypothetical protein